MSRPPFAHDVEDIMKRHWKKIVGAVVLLAVLVAGGSWFYAKVLNKSDPAFDQSDVNTKLDAATTTAIAKSSSTAAVTIAPAITSATTPVTGAATGAATAAGVDGTWTIKDGSEVGYRVKETINGFDTTANGRSTSISGSMDASGATISSGEFTVDMTTFSSDESRRDAQFNGRVMEVAKFPEAKFTLTAPIDFKAVPAEGGTVTASAAGDLTLHGATKSVTFDVQGTFKNGLIGVLGQIPVVFADYGIANPSIGTVKTEDNGVLEFVLVLVRK
jgi:polyisoprenoid-binding protein YceI